MTAEMPPLIPRETLLGSLRIPAPCIVLDRPPCAADASVVVLAKGAHPDLQNVEIGQQPVRRLHEAAPIDKARDEIELRDYHLRGLGVQGINRFLDVEDIGDDGQPLRLDSRSQLR